MEESDVSQHLNTDKVTEDLNALLIEKRTFDEVQRYYQKSAQKQQFDKILLAHKEIYSAPDVAMKTMTNLFAQPQDALVLDLGSGVGQIGKELVERGFKNIHALEPCEEFNKISRSLNIYQRILEQPLGYGVPVDAEIDTYDAVVTVGTFCPGHIPCDALYDIIRILKPGGYFVNCMREEFLTIVPEYKDRLEPLANQLVEEGKWKKISWERYDNHFKEKYGIVMVFQAC